jgi:hypothetical protein
MNLMGSISFCSRQTQGELRFRDEVEAFLDPHTPEAERKVAIRPDRILAALLGYGHGSSRTATVA